MVLTLEDRWNFSFADSVSSKSVSSDSCSRVPNATLGVSDSTLNVSSDLHRFDRLPVGDDRAVDGALRFRPCTRTFVSSLMDWSDIFRGGKDAGQLGGWDSAHNKDKTTCRFYDKAITRKSVRTAGNTWVIAGPQLTVVITMTRHCDNAVVEKGANSCCAAGGFPLRNSSSSLPPLTVVMAPPRNGKQSNFTDTSRYRQRFNRYIPG